MKAFLALVLSQSLYITCAFAGQPPTALPPNVSTHKISYKTYHGRYENVGPSTAVPKLLVFSRSGACVGVSDGETSSSDRIMTFVEESLKNDKKACDATPYHQAQGARPQQRPANQKPEVDLIVFGMPFCGKCNDYQTTLVQAAQESLASARIQFLAVDLGGFK